MGIAVVSCAKNKVLVVEDEALIRMIGADTLAEAGYEVIEAETADEAITILNEGADVQVLFTDIRMPGSMDGMALARFVHERWPTVKILLTSGDTWPRKCDIPDDGHFLPKPYDLHALKIEVKHLTQK
jgi:DNA-binding NtrC family response regulator